MTEHCRYCGTPLPTSAGPFCSHRCRWDQAALDSDEEYVGAPYVKDSETSKAAAVSVAGHTKQMRERIWRYIKAHGQRGRTCDEVEVGSGLCHQTVSARISELKRKSRLYQNGKRPTRSGRPADVHIARDATAKQA